jgi:hypothetical protein
MKNVLLAIAWALIFNLVHSQNVDYTKIYQLGLDSDIESALTLVQSYEEQKLNEKERDFIGCFKDRFMHDQDKSDYLRNHDSKINTLLSMYRDYWRKSLLSNGNYDSALVYSLLSFLKNDYPKVSENTDTLDLYLKEYIKSKGYFTTGFGRVGRLYDLLVWKAEKDTVYHIKNKLLDNKVRVVFMSDFVSLGWEDYATFGKYYPGGWAEEEKVYCVIDSYDITSEKFKVSFLAHEGQHFFDYQHFPDLTSYELEYRAKLVELALVDERLYHLIEFFISNSNSDSKNGHSKANFYVIANLSKVLFNTDFEEDIDKWKQLKKKKINKTALKLLHSNTQILKKKVKVSAG